MAAIVLEDEQANEQSSGWDGEGKGEPETNCRSPHHHGTREPKKRERRQQLPGCSIGLCFAIPRAMAGEFVQRERCVNATVRNLR